MLNCTWNASSYSTDTLWCSARQFFLSLKHTIASQILHFEWGLDWTFISEHTSHWPRYSANVTEWVPWLPSPRWVCIWHLNEWMYEGWAVIIRPLHHDPQWSVVLWYMTLTFLPFAWILELWLWLSPPGALVCKWQLSWFHKSVCHIILTY
jgi:hypothetical protein